MTLRGTTLVWQLYFPQGFSVRFTIPRSAIYLGVWAYTMRDDKNQRVALLEIALYCRLQFEWIIE